MRKQTTTLLVGATLLALLTSSCQKENLPIPQKEENPIIKTSVSTPRLELRQKMMVLKHPQRSQEEALYSVKNLINNNEQFRAYQDLKLSVDYILNDKEYLRSDTKKKDSQVDTLLFIINFGNDNGFALVSGDKRTTDLLAVVKSGSLNKSKSIKDTGLRLFLSRLPKFYKNSIREYKEKVHSLIHKTKESFRCQECTGPDDCREYQDEMDRMEEYYSYCYSKYTPWKETLRTPLLVPVIWGQESPYNDNAVKKNNQNCAAGCTATAFAQLLAAHKYPHSFDGININWAILTDYSSLTSQHYGQSIEDYNNAIVNVAKLFRKLGDHLENKWGLPQDKGSGAWPYKIPGILRKMGYTNVSDEKEYNEYDVINSIKNNRPVILSGYEEEYYYKTGWWLWEETKTNYRGGHTFVADGILNQERIETLYGPVEDEEGNYDPDICDVIKTDVNKRTLIHINWGWSGSFNGYFESGVFDSKNPIEYFRSIKDPDNFSFNLKCIVNVAP